MGSRLEQNSSAVRKRLESHSFDDEAGEEYEASSFGGFGDYFRRKKIKLQNLDVELRAKAGDKPQIFRGVVAHIMGYTQPSLQVLHKELVQHGACFLQYLDSKTMATHIIASVLPPKKVVDYNSYRMVKPQWVVDSISAGKLLPWTDYRVFDEGPRQKTLKFGHGGKMVAEASQLSQLGYKEHTQSSFYTAQLLEHAAGLLPADAASPPYGDRADGLTRTPRVGAGGSSLGGYAELEESPDNFDKEASSKSRESSPTRALQADIVEDDFLGHSETGPGHSEPIARPEITARPDGKPMTSEEHNAILLKDPKIWKSSTANPDFLRQFYSESRLHHLSTWKAELKSKMQKLAAEKGPPPKAVRRKPGSRRYILHVDFDSFFCAVSLKSAPEYITKPAVVAHGTGTGSEIASCNYPARELGVKNGMWMKRALELCPTIKVLPYDFPAYEQASQMFYEAILGVGGVVQSVSVDEALLDVTTLVLDASASTGIGVDEGSLWREQEKANEIASRLRDEIKQKTDCSVSVGIGPNILLAKVALRKAKPAGQYQVKPEEALAMIGELKVEDLPGVAYSIKGKLEEVGVRLVKDIREMSRARLTAILGPKTGEKLWDYARGIDSSEVADQPLRKSVSAEVNWGVRFVDQQEAEEFLMRLAKELEKRLLGEGVKGKNFTMKIMRRSRDAPLDPPKHLGHGKCDTFNKSVAFGIATYSADVIGKEAVAILRSYNFRPGDLRGLGMQLTKLEPIKGSVSAPESSQKTLSFGGGFLKQPSGKKAAWTEGIEDDEGHGRKVVSGHDMAADPIDVSPMTPRKPKLSPMHSALAFSISRQGDALATTPLNVNGTQFIIPSHADPEIVAALPPDIRSKVLAQQQRRQESAPLRDESPSARSRTHSPMRPGGPVDIPSQIDLEVFDALPEELKTEVLASYGRTETRWSPSRARGGQQALLPKSPHRDRVIDRPLKRTTPTKRGGIRNMLNRARERQHDAEAGLLQTNLLTGQAREGERESSVDDDQDELDQEVVAALPEDMRREVLADHRRRRLAQLGQLDIQLAPYQHRAWPEDQPDHEQATVEFPRRPSKVEFTKQSLSSTAQIKDMLALWFRDTMATGPHQRDLEVFEQYLCRVVLEEKDLEKVWILVTWIEWLVDDADGTGKTVKGRRRWQAAVQEVRDKVQGAMKERGLGPMNFG